MKCLTIEQPWASLLTAGITRFDLRKYQTRIRERVAIHAGQEFPMANRILCRTPSIQSILRRLGFYVPADLPTQAILGSADLVDCLPLDDFDLELLNSAADGPRFLQAEPDHWVWVFEDPQPLEQPIFWRNTRLLVELPSDILDNPTYRAIPVLPTLLIRRHKNTTRRGNALWREEETGE